MERDHLLRWLRGDVAAVALIEDLGAITQTWDDLADGDAAVSHGALDDAFVRALTMLPRNPFWLRHQADLLPLLEAWILDWQTANVIERGQLDNQDMLRVAWVIRDSSAALIVACARIVGGWAWARAVSLEVRAWLHDEPFDRYVGGLDQPAAPPGKVVTGATLAE